ncbi:ANTAR domain-containing protein [Streptomyces doebereineriae]|uniref:ANTAR domain-containing protein n=1 Tax=Streptomyces doebereineriae TaxID=3075528 RepID=A0ABU2VID2_9ACTN|nr:ANTAR domain-containing protein [Streptomyces sp. DSM 41640]MDT0485343.1 ANTAR domain-containing protein [Streptomyces sp. DSM 41640]
MTTSRVPRPSRDGTRDDATNDRLEQENEQLRHAVDSHATVDQAIGVLTAIHQLAPAAGFDVLREVSQHTNTKLHTVAGTVIAWALGQPLPESVGRELDAAVQRRSGQRNAPDAEAG